MLPFVMTITCAKAVKTPFRRGGMFCSQRGGREQEGQARPRGVIRALDSEWVALRRISWARDVAIVLY